MRQSARLDRGETTAVETLRVLVADDHPIYRQGLCDLLAGQPDLEVVAEAADGAEAVELARQFCPHVALVDTQMPGMSGIEAAENIRASVPGCGIILLTLQEDEEQLLHAAKAGAAALLLKDVQPNELVTAIRRVAAGEHLIDETVGARPAVASRVLKQFRDLAAASRDSDQPFTPLSTREIEVLDHIARGSSNKQIARTLKISDQTVKNHITSILRKLGVNDRTQAVVFALRRGWIKMQGV